MSSSARLYDAVTQDCPRPRCLAHDVTSRLVACTKTWSLILFLIFYLFLRVLCLHGSDVSRKYTATLPSRLIKMKQRHTRYNILYSLSHKQLILEKNKPKTTHQR